MQCEAANLLWVLSHWCLKYDALQHYWRRSAMSFEHWDDYPQAFAEGAGLSTGRKLSFQGRADVSGNSVVLTVSMCG